ncbi:putative zinc finger protein [Roseateles toxinivorans]|uniref:Putative zinc finger protein n=2 Tax=Roseateles toxinivorans TaxID=270368 RepID=A0A4V3CU15_9BURK|nr:zf-HC2 domain-containing protein [Roseateles toxinivorans]TDP74968.1 putative zinc finger protein [Roseateles toxinivorans]
MMLMKNCREVTGLTLQSLDRELSWQERLAVRLHMVICSACPKFARQAQFMRSAMGRWKSYSEQDKR